MATIFYSWQSDIANSINRGFIKDALEKAIKEVAESLSLDDAPRLDQDTSGVPGSPEITETILKKIEDCVVFVPDLTIVAHTENGDPSPNPNVLIEYGYAQKTLGSERIISVMNEAYGSAEDSLPFDLKHRRWPIRYNLLEGASEENKKKQREQLKKELINALKTIIEAGLLKPKGNSLTENHPMWKSSSFTSGETDIIARTTPRTRRDIIWFNGPQAFLRIIPTQIKNWTPFQIEELIRSGGLGSMGGEGNAQWILRNNRGAINVSCNDDGKPNTYLTAVGLTQVFKNGEIWGIEGNSLREKAVIKEGEKQIQYIAAGYIENLFAQTLQNYLNWARLSLKVNPPLKYVLGLSGIQDYSISISSHTIDGYCTEDEVIAKGEINDLNIKIADILIPFFKNVWESCGIRRPEKRE